MFIKTKYLIPTHNSLRNPELVTKFLGNLNLLNEALDNNEDKINIIEMEGILYVLNSHHRMVAVNMAYGKIKESELNIQSYTLDEMLTANPEIGWVTPFDPYFYCRISDFKLQKQRMIDRFQRTFEGLSFFNRESQKLIEPRKVHSLGELYDI